MSIEDAAQRAAAARRAADEAEAAARAVAAQDAERARRETSESQAEAAQAARDAVDPRVGTRITTADGRAGVIERRRKDAYLVKLDTGGRCWVLVSGVERIEAKTAAGGDDTVAAVIAAYQRDAEAARLGDTAARARMTMIDLAAMRSGREPRKLTASDRAEILARVMSGPPITMPAEAKADILRRLDPAAKKPDDYAEGVRDNVHRLIRSGARAINSGR